MMMKMNSTKKIMSCVGTVMAVGAVVAFAGSCMTSNTQCMKRKIKKMANKMTDVIDAVASMM